MRKVQYQPPGADYRISAKDYYQILSSALFIIIGITILVRSLQNSIVVIALLMGGGFLALGVYRLRFVVKYFRERHKCNPM
jgi:uncharacterized membrane protein HdeD (DUF308 family)